MKSAYELAMERLEKNAPTVSLTDEQKAQIAEIDSSYRAKIAEKELFLKDQIRSAQRAGSLEHEGRDERAGQFAVDDGAEFGDGHFLYSTYCLSSPAERQRGEGDPGVGHRLVSIAGSPSLASLRYARRG